MPGYTVEILLINGLQQRITPHLHSPPGRLWRAGDALDDPQSHAPGPARSGKMLLQFFKFDGLRPGGGPVGKRHLTTLAQPFAQLAPFSRIVGLAVNDPAIFPHTVPARPPCGIRADGAQRV